MSHLSVEGEQNTSVEIATLQNLTALPVNTSQALTKTGPQTFELIPVGSGAAPLTAEIPKGVVNGVNLIFTVNNLPVFIEVSGQVMVSSAVDNTNYGYVIGGTGPYTINFVTAPSSIPTLQTPHSFHN